jgi:hypothetical protein
MTLPVFRRSTIANPQLTAAVMMKLSAPPSTARPSRRTETEASGSRRNRSEQRVEKPGRGGREQTQNDRAFRAATVRIVTRPRSRNQRCGELTSGNDADHEGAKSQSVVYVQRKHGHGDADDEKTDENDAHDRQQLRCKRTQMDSLLHGSN